jgi:hypothetical protein
MLLPLVLLSFFMQGPPPDPAETKALAYLAREVPGWSKGNGCFSCHNNGDGARALYVATRLGRPVAAEALSDTTAWLMKPEEWNKDQAGAGFANKTLAPIQFAAAMTEALDAGLIDRPALIRAAEELVSFQEANGSWEVNTGAAAASPVTYGSTLATYMARRILDRTGDPRFAEAIRRADEWFLAEASPGNVMNTAAIVLALADRQTAAAREKAKMALGALAKSQGSDGGFGPYANSPAEVFDTAIALIAMASWPDRSETAESIQRGRAFLINAQLPDGGWTETTRPSGGSSYAQHISTCGWAALALMQTH